MCGILFHVRTSRPPDLAETNILDKLIQSRGPDSFRTISRTITQHDQILYLTFSASVLSLRGLSPIVQPLEDVTSGCLLMWNGEAWKLGDQVVTVNDTELIFDALLTALAAVTDADARFLVVKNVLRKVTGPFAFLFYDHITQRIIYGRDAIGRRSLLISEMFEGNVCIASVSDTVSSPAWVEVKTGGVHELNLLKLSASVDHALRFIPWALPSENFFPSLNRSIEVPPNYTLPSTENVDKFHSILVESIRLRTIDTAPWLKLTENNDQFAVLFSGGVDCTLLAYMLDQVLPAEHSIDLLNVAFENPRVIAAAQRNTTSDTLSMRNPENFYDACPDRKTGLSSYTELCKICPMRQWRFVRINVPFADTLAQKSTVISLMHPHDTEMDLSISLALFFASRGVGTIEKPTSNTPYTTSARVLFSGLGADELFGGYTRHAKAYNHSGLMGLLSELDLDYSRLADRNLGRDDRIIPHWAREIRYPYLDEDLCAWALGLPVWEKCGFASIAESGVEGALEPSKLLLRMLADRVGLKNAAREKKRAIQFGARTAKMSAGRTKGTDSIDG